MKPVSRFFLRTLIILALTGCKVCEDNYVPFYGDLAYEWVKYDIGSTLAFISDSTSERKVFEVSHFENKVEEEKEGAWLTELVTLGLANTDDCIDFYNRDFRIEFKEIIGNTVQDSTLSWYFFHFGQDGVIFIWQKSEFFFDVPTFENSTDSSYYWQRIERIEINGKVYNNVAELNFSCPNCEDRRVQNLYLEKENGIIGFKYPDGEFFGLQ